MQQTLQTLDPAAAEIQPADHTIATVFYDGSCPLCRREINHYRGLRGAERLIWIDISRDRSMLHAHGLSYASAMARLHVLDASGQWQIGAYGFVELWAHLPAYRWLAVSLRQLHLLKPLDRLYSGFAKWRLRRRCGTASCDNVGTSRAGRYSENDTQ